MNKIKLLPVILLFFAKGFSQERSINKLTLETTYSFAEIHKSLRDLVDDNKKANYFNDDFFNGILKKIVQDKQFSEREKVLLFYMMQKKIGFAFVGVDYLPPKQNYFNHHSAKIITWQKTKSNMKDLNYNTSGLLKLVDENYAKDAIIASNALLLATLLNTDSVTKKLEYYTQGDIIMQAKNPDIFNHYVCLSASVLQSPVIVANLVKNITTFKTEGFIEDALCALYSKNNPVATIKEYILQEQNMQNDLAIETALCALAVKVPAATFQQSIKNLGGEAKEKWKSTLCKIVADNKLAFNYSLSNKDQLVTKTWEGVQMSIYTDGILISNGALLEFDAN